jgi:hypothetical protein
LPILCLVTVTLMVTVLWDPYGRVGDSALGGALAGASGVALAVVGTEGDDMDIQCGDSSIL